MSDLLPVGGGSVPSLQSDFPDFVQIGPINTKTDGSDRFTVNFALPSQTVR